MLCWSSSPSHQFNSVVIGPRLRGDDGGDNMPKSHGPLRIGGDNLAATFSPELADLTIYVIDVAAGDKIPSKGGPGITRSDLLVINKIDLAPYVGASLEKMDTDARRMRGERPFVMSNLKKSEGLDRIVGFIETKGGLRPQVKVKAG